MRLWDYFDNKPFSLLDGKSPDDSLEHSKIMDNNPILVEEQLLDGSWAFADEPQTTETYATSAGYNSSYPSSTLDVPSVPLTQALNRLPCRWVSLSRGASWASRTWGTLASCGAHMRKWM